MNTESEIEKVKAQLKANRDIVLTLVSRLIEIERATKFDEREYETLNAKIEQLKDEEAELRQRYYKLVEKKHGIQTLMKVRK